MPTSFRLGSFRARWKRNARPGLDFGHNEQKQDTSKPPQGVHMLLLLLLLLLLIVAIGGGIVISKFLFLVLVIALIVAIVGGIGRRSSV